MLRFLLLTTTLLLTATHSFCQDTTGVGPSHGLRLWGVVHTSIIPTSINPENRWPLGFFALGYGWQRQRKGYPIIHDLMVQRLAFRERVGNTSSTQEADLQLVYDQSRFWAGDSKLSVWWGVGAMIQYANNTFEPSTSTRFPREEWQFGGSLLGLIRLRAQLNTHLHAEVKAYPLVARYVRHHFYTDNPSLSPRQKAFSYVSTEWIFFRRALIGLSYTF